MGESDILQKILTWLVSGHSRTEIRQMIRSDATFADYSNSACDGLINNSKKLLEENVVVDTKQITSVQVSLYEKIYHYYHLTDVSSGMNKAMKGKERLLNLSGTHNKVLINRTSDINIRRELVYDHNRLTLEQFERVKYLLTLAGRVTDDMVYTGRKSLQYTK